jgi:hypothetical protein
MIKKRVLHDRKKKFSPWLHLIPESILEFIVNYQINGNSSIWFQIDSNKLHLGYSEHYIITKYETINNINPFPYTVIGNGFNLDLHSEKELRSYFLSSIRS